MPIAEITILGRMALGRSNERPPVLSGSDRRYDLDPENGSVVRSPVEFARAQERTGPRGSVGDRARVAARAAGAPQSRHRGDRAYGARASMAD